MPRPRIIRSTIYPYHVRSRANNQEWFYLPIQRTWEIMCAKMCAAIELYRPLIHAFVLMNNHLHLILSTPEGNLDSVMQYFIRECSKAIGYESGRINRIFGGRYQRSLITSDVYFRNAMKYVFRNPVAAGITARSEEYAYSSLPWTLGEAHPKFELSERTEFLYRGFPQGPLLLDWLDTAYTKRQSELMRKALRRSTFKWSNARTHRHDIQQMTNM